jgi:putative tryptophan/tyrosine transport system substrate-binding protein
MKKAAALSILVAVILLAVGVIAEAQQSKKVPRIGSLANGSPSSDAARIEAFRQGLRELGYVEGQKYRCRVPLWEGKTEQFFGLATELVQLKVEVIVAGGATGNWGGQKSHQANPNCHGECH